MKVKTDELVAEKEAKEVSEAIKDLDILTELCSHALQDLCFLFWQSLYFYWGEIVLHHLWLVYLEQ